MRHGIHFIAGLPRSGSTLLSALLRQNPRFHTSMTAPVATLFNALQREMSQGNEYSLFINDDQRLRILAGVFEGYYHDIHPEKVVFDTNRAWTTKLPALTRLFPQAKVICCVRNVAWVLDSLESLSRRNCLEPSKIYNFDPGGTVYTRCEGLASATGMVGFALHGLREALFGQQADRVMLVTYETLTSKPLEALAKIYEFIDEPLFAHDPDHVEACKEAAEYDRRLGAYGLHDLRSRVQHTTRPSILPKDLFKRYEALSFWLNPFEMPLGIRTI